MINKKISAMLLILFFSLFIISAVKVKYSYKHVITIESYTVQPGDTLFSIAGKYPHDDLRRLVYEIRDINGVNDCLIYPGEELKIPIEK